MGNNAAYDLWWKNAVIYCLDVELFADGDGDGCGDFPGLTGKVDYLAGLGVTCIWLMPFYPTPNKDNGYDITDFYGVDPRLGTLGDLVEFLRAARERGMRVIADLVVNHTSDQHPWFQSARADERSPWRDFYVWADEQPEGPPGVVFPDAEDSNWDYDEVAGKWFLHRFYSHMPDLNIANPRVRDEISKIVGYWLELGMSGFRVDAAPFVIELAGTEAERGQDPHDFLVDLRAFLNRRRGDAVLLAEAEREEVFAALAPDPDMRSFGRGIRRRVPTMLEGDRDRMELLYSLLFTLPGSPVLLYGEEIGLGDDQRIPGRGAVRVAMQWTPGPHAGFTAGDPAVPLVTDGPFGPDRVNVATERRAPESLLNWMERAIRARKELPELGWGTWRVLDTDHPAVLALRRDWQGQGVLALHNLGREPVKVGVELGDDVEAGRPMAELLGNRHHEPATSGQPLALGGFGYRWLRLSG